MRDNYAAFTFMRDAEEDPSFFEAYDVLHPAFCTRMSNSLFVCKQCRLLSSGIDGTRDDASGQRSLSMASIMVHVETLKRRRIR